MTAIPTRLAQGQTAIVGLQENRLDPANRMHHVQRLARFSASAFGGCPRAVSP